MNITKLSAVLFSGEKKLAAGFGSICADIETAFIPGYLIIHTRAV